MESYQQLYCPQGQYPYNLVDKIKQQQLPPIENLNNNSDPSQISPQVSPIPKSYCSPTKTTTFFVEVDSDSNTYEPVVPIDQTQRHKYHQHPEQASFFPPTPEYTTSSSMNPFSSSSSVGDTLITLFFGLFYTIFKAFKCVFRVVFSGFRSIWHITERTYSRHSYQYSAVETPRNRRIRLLNAMNWRSNDEIGLPTYEQRNFNRTVNYPYLDNSNNSFEKAYKRPGDFSDGSSELEPFRQQLLNNTLSQYSSNSNSNSNVNSTQDVPPPVPPKTNSNIIINVDDDPQIIDNNDNDNDISYLGTRSKVIDLTINTPQKAKLQPRENISKTRRSNKSDRQETLLPAFKPLPTLTQETNKKQQRRRHNHKEEDIIEIKKHEFNQSNNIAPKPPIHKTLSRKASHTEQDQDEPLLILDSDDEKVDNDLTTINMDPDVEVLATKHPSQGNNQTFIVQTKRNRTSDTFLTSIAKNNTLYSKSDKGENELVDKIEDLTISSDIIEPLRDDQLRQVKKIWKKSEDSIIINSFRINITGSDIQTLKDHQWLNDNIIDYYLSLITERSKNSNDKKLPLIFNFSTHFYTTLENKGYNGVERWGSKKKLNIFNIDYIFIPVNRNNTHWCLAVINLKKKKFEFYDSMGGSAGPVFPLLLNYMINETKKQYNQNNLNLNIDFNMYENWEMKDRIKCPKQTNGSDCGVFTCKFAEVLSSNKKLNFHQSDMKNIRRRMVYEIITKKLL